jgi:hypothetical protein
MLTACGRIGFDTGTNPAVGPDAPEVMGGGQVTTLSNSTGEGAFAPTIAWTGGAFAIAWEDSRGGIYFARVDASGTQLGSEVQLGATGRNAHLVWSGMQLYLAFSSGAPSEVFFASFFADGGRILDDVRVTNAAGLSDVTDACWDGANLVVTWDDSRDTPSGNVEVYAGKIAPSGARVGADVRVSNDRNISLEPAIACLPSGYAIAWIDNRDNMNAAYENYFRAFDTTLTPTTVENRITTTASLSQRPALVWTGSELVIAWYDQRNSEDKIFVQQRTADGSVLSGDQPVTPSHPGFGPRVAWTGSDIGVVRAAEDGGGPDDWRVRFSRASPTGAVLAGEGLVSTGPKDAMSTAIAWNGSLFGVVWSEQVNGVPQIRFRTVQ